LYCGPRGTEQEGIEVWIDVDRVKGDIYVAMANVVVLMSRAYEIPANCQSELAYACKQMKKIIPLLA
jgi:hypothetical protein